MIPLGTADMGDEGADDVVVGSLNLPGPCVIPLFFHDWYKTSAC